MRVTVAVGIAVVMLFVGLYGASYAGQSVQDTALNGSENAKTAYNFTSDFAGDTTTFSGQAIIWGGVAAIVLVSLGYLLAASRGGR